MPLIVALVLAFAIGIGLQRLIKGDLVLASKPCDYARIWSSWVVFLATLATLTGFFIQLDVDSFAVWVLAVVVYGGAGYGAGWLYGKFFGNKSIPEASDQATRGQDPETQETLPVKPPQPPRKPRPFAGFQDIPEQPRKNNGPHLELPKGKEQP